MKLTQPRHIGNEIRSVVKTPPADKNKNALVLAEPALAKPMQVDDGKRGFLRFAGIVGLGVVASQMLPGKASAYVMGGTPTSNVVGLKDSSNNRVNPAKEDGNLATIATQSGLLTFDSGSTPGGNLKVNIAAIPPGGLDFGLQNASNVTINPAMEDGNLATVKTNTGTIATNTANLTNLTFNAGALVTTGGGVVGVKDTTSTQINPSTDDSLVYLRRMVKLMESQAAVDSGNRQRITLDSLGTGTAVTTTVPVSGTVTTNTAAGTNTIGSVLVDGQGRQMFTEIARQAYNSGIRTSLVFS